MSDRERERFLDQMATAEASIAPADPWMMPVVPATTRVRPDSLVSRGESQPLEVTMPEPYDAGTHYPVVVELAPSDRAPARDAITVARMGRSVASAAEIVAFMRDKYGIDVTRLTVHGADRPMDPPHPPHERHHHRHH